MVGDSKTMDLATYLEQLPDGERKGICIVPKECLEAVLDDNLKIQANQAVITEKLSDSMIALTQMIYTQQESVTSNIAATNTNIATMNSNITAVNTNLATMNGNIMEVNTNLATMNGHLEKIVEILNRRGEIQTTPMSAIDIEDIIRRRNILVEKVVRSELLSEFYEELINEASPYAPPKFRTKVQKNTPERDLRHRRTQTVNTVRTEIALMQDRITDWKNQITERDTEVEEYLTSNEPKRREIVARVQGFQPKYREQFARTNLTKLKDEYEKDKRDNYEFLVSVVDDDDEDHDNDEASTKNRKGKRGQQTGRNRRNRPRV